MNKLNENIASRPGEIMSAPIYFVFMVINMHLVRLGINFKDFYCHHCIKCQQQAAFLI
jgi:hypothetical protein